MITFFFPETMSYFDCLRYALDRGYGAADFSHSITRAKGFIFAFHLA